MLERMQSSNFSIIAHGHTKWYTEFGRQFHFFTKLKIVLAYDSAVVFLGIYPIELKTYVYTKTCKQIFLAALFIIAPNRKQPRYPFIGE